MIKPLNHVLTFFSLYLAPLFCSVLILFADYASIAFLWSSTHLHQHIGLINHAIGNDQSSLCLLATESSLQCRKVNFLTIHRVSGTSCSLTSFLTRCPPSTRLSTSPARWRRKPATAPAPLAAWARTTLSAPSSACSWKSSGRTLNTCRPTTGKKNLLCRRFQKDFRHS